MSALEGPLDVLIIGAGPAGTVAAALLHRQGLSVQIVEQTRFPRFVIGESLLPHCMDVLDEAGLLEAVRAKGFQVKNGALFFRGPARRPAFLGATPVERCEFSFADQHSPGWTWTWQVPRAEFDQALADEVSRRGVPIHYRHTVTAARFEGSPEITVRDEESGRSGIVRPRFVIDASGYGRVLPRLLDLEAPSSLAPRTALFTHVTGDPRTGPDRERIWICLDPRGAWIWIIPFSDGRTSIGVVAEEHYFGQFPGQPEDQLRAIIAANTVAGERLDRLPYLFPPRTLAGYSVGVKRLYGPGHVLTGNATEFLDPVFSSGVTLALESASRASRLVAAELRGQPADWEADYAQPMQRGVDVFRTFVTRWYDGMLPELFFSPVCDTAVKAQLCSVLAGYVWDEGNPIVRHHARRIPQLARLAKAPAAESTLGENVTQASDLPPGL